MVNAPTLVFSHMSHDFRPSRSLPFRRIIEQTPVHGTVSKIFRSSQYTGPSEKFPSTRDRSQNFPQYTGPPNFFRSTRDRPKFCRSTRDRPLFDSEIIFTTVARRGARRSTPLATSPSIVRAWVVHKCISNRPRPISPSFLPSFHYLRPTRNTNRGYRLCLHPVAVRAGPGI